MILKWWMRPLCSDIYVILCSIPVAPCHLIHNDHNKTKCSIIRGMWLDDRQTEMADLPLENDRKVLESCGNFEHPVTCHNNNPNSCRATKNYPNHEMAMWCCFLHQTDTKRGLYWLKFSQHRVLLDEGKNRQVGLSQAMIMWGVSLSVFDQRVCC